MRVCEVCGMEEEMEEQEHRSTPRRIIHVCENCQHDRRFHSYNEDI
ncbi:MAG TPA: hypothetical protein VEY51_05405 [Chondromyces sp.]|nr:hypothetical protein [Chondromyces sp.]